MTQSKKSVKIAITGGIGSGKTTVAQILRDLNFQVFSCDEIYAELLRNPDFIRRIEKEFNGVLTDDGKLDRKKLAETVFDDAEKLNKLNSITHPEIMNAAIGKLNDFSLGFCEVPLLFESGFQRLFDGVIVVLRDRGERVNSVVLRDGIGRESVIKRINSQLNYDNADFAKYYVLHNKGDLNYLKEQVSELIGKIVKEFKIF